MRARVQRLIIRPLLEDLQSAISETKTKNCHNQTGFSCCRGNLAASHQITTCRKTRSCVPQEGQTISKKSAVTADAVHTNAGQMSPHCPFPVATRSKSQMCADCADSCATHKTLITSQGTCVHHSRTVLFIQSKVFWVTWFTFIYTFGALLVSITELLLEFSPLRPRGQRHC